MLQTIIQISWTDACQAIGALISIPAAIVGFIFFFRKDKEKAEQISKLSAIAANLNQMTSDSEKRYIQTRKPIIEILIKNQYSAEQLMILFENRNTTSAVINFNLVNVNDAQIIKHPITDDKGIQKFAMTVKYFQHYSDLPHLKIEYTTSEGYIFESTFQMVSENPRAGTIGANVSPPSIK
ncbi:MAG: hypothetical protein ACO1N0_12710 [Fluviicola sp.]